MAGRLGKVLRAPALHFLALGALLATLEARTVGTAAATARLPILIPAARVAEIRDDYQRTAQTVPTAEELAALVARDADEEMLYREALLLGLDRGDRAVHWRIVEKMHFLFGDAAGEPEAAYRRGMELGLAKGDVVVRNIMVTKMRLLAKAASRSEEPTGADLDRDLEAYRQAHAAAYGRGARLTLTQVFVSAGKRGAALVDDARALASRLQAGDMPPDSAVRLGDPFAGGHAFRKASEKELSKIFGEAFAAAAARLEPGHWSAPIPSTYGRHLVLVTAREAAELPPLTAVRPRVLRAYRAERRARYLARMTEELRTAYEVRVDGP